MPRTEPKPNNEVQGSSSGNWVDFGVCRKGSPLKTWLTATAGWCWSAPCRRTNLGLEPAR